MKVHLLAAIDLFLLSSSLPAQNGFPRGAYYVVTNTNPPDAFLALRTHPSTNVGHRITRMPNGTALQVLERKPDGWWYVRVFRTGQEGWALSRQGETFWIVAKDAPWQDPLYERDYICRGVLTVNRTETSTSHAFDDGWRLVRADDINSSCLFQTNSENGKRILANCRMGYGCEVTAKVNSTSSDVAYIVYVYSAVSSP